MLEKPPGGPRAGPGSISSIRATIKVEILQEKGPALRAELESHFIRKSRLNAEYESEHNKVD